MVERIEEIEVEAQAAVEAADSAAELEEVRVRYLGRKAELTGMLRGIADLPPEQRGPVGSTGNKVRKGLEGLIEAKVEALRNAELEQSLAGDRIDVTLPGSPARAVGHLHPITRTRRLIEDVMIGLGYQVMEGPEVEHDYYNFTALNHPEGHPARMLQDTFYVDTDEHVEQVLLRTHTSPMQVRAMESAPPPLFMIVPGKTYRRDSDATHSPMFHQVEGLAVGEGITLADLKGTLLAMLREIFGPDREIRMRPHFFPFTEPSVEFDVSCFRCGGSGSLEDGSRCGLCKGIGWIELGGAGMVDPNVFGFVADSGYDPDSVTGFAFGFGIERIAMLQHNVGDLRLFFDNDLRMLEQFS
ncbi:MAG TPA: phenylalanine--tRNA ligase subunit alpha [Solirubrobacterales bacterium]|nr:phenylalanine--tRNA ligase subunit alpha [Solirubrobacterales bacterium]HMX70488.1 phenylalanine--tRNA ligase subunit alpha [Solirubrobacterales bacterium]HNA23449.1 phenylalanine--tRNA ligase subunit alpha [Solirubrobacterales bacterium]HNA43206.1 phenylalanine--tRNA ligase subunit alpha [Solirubrobacterales bacterium]HNC15927.1 phenylalanine--tRNA ligase subunit alpha [Solirubrobacterales bacterium]